MQNNAAVFRSGEILEEGCTKLDSLYKDLKDVKVCIKLCAAMIMIFVHRYSIKELCGTLT